ncbi:glycine betaine ABC transporter substrate-binding protein [Occultella gossypii]|uniref:Glycine betaine ABC transporter substrate-binding protein n=1 Tax=Occultella gossypii TaxID=2800820 RepID=A0ABS7S918_9MICO|nr:glycine betaine ABC transporter substrate-binding protein [Occultella gossypii]MBZ2196408.1 glycine betaine ABC transporter substrate-binding protein [Occultella gossypii]
MRSTLRRTTTVLAGITALSLGLAACGGGGTDAGGDSDDGAGTGDDLDTVTIGIPAGWDEGVAVSYLWKAVLENNGYTVEVEDADIGVVFTSVAGGGYDLMFDAWLPVTHEDLVAEYGEQLEDLGSWYEGAALTIAVNEDSPAQSIADLASMSDEYGNRLVGIDAGAGLTRITQEEVIPTYELEGMEFVISSTAAMLAELQGATDSGDNIAVTLWRPHWAYDAYPIRDLEDPEATLGDSEEIHTFGRLGFGEDFPQFAGWLENFTLTDEQLASLENLMLNENGGTDNDASAQQWLEDNPDFVESVTGA